MSTYQTEPITKLLHHTALAQWEKNNPKECVFVNSAERELWIFKTWDLFFFEHSVDFHKER